MSTTKDTTGLWRDRVESGDWEAITAEVNDYGGTLPGVDYTGGEFLLLEQRPRAQSRRTATPLPHGHGYLFTTRDRPVKSARGWSVAPVRHGVSAIRSGERHTLALVFHDAA